MRSSLARLAFLLLSGIVGCITASVVVAAEPADSAELWKKIAPYFQPAPPAPSTAVERLRSPLERPDGTRVADAEAWKKRREEIRAEWHKRMGAWPPVIEQPKIEALGETEREGIVQKKIRFEIAPGKPIEGYLLIPPGEGKRPAMLGVFYEPETLLGLKEKQDSAFSWKLAKRGFVTLSIGIGGSLYLPNAEKAEIQPLSALGYGAANAYHVLAAQPEVDPARIGVIGHSYGGKWAMFASCLYDKFACGVWSDGGIVFDEARGNVNYWEPWYLGFEAGKKRKAGIPKEDNPRTGAYREMIADGRNLHELHVLMAPRPFLVSGGSEDPPARWQALAHSVEVNKLLGYENRVAMTNRPTHGLNDEANEQIALFLEYMLKHNHALDPAKRP